MKQLSRKHQAVVVFNHSKTSFHFGVDANLLPKPKDKNALAITPSIVHDLKTPLSSIIGLADVLQEVIKNPESRKECLEYISDIKKTAYEMNDLIHDLLDFASVTSGVFSFDLANEISVAEVVVKSAKLNKYDAARNKISLKTKIDDVAPIKLDPKRTKQILVNLVSNAIKYSPQNTEIKISAKNIFKNNKKYLEIIVSDQGFGMTESQIKTAFEKYQTIPNLNSDKVDSCGLGLPITKQLVELQNGTISVKSEVGKGSDFILHFPY